MSPTIALLSILGALLVGVVSPGPSFVLVSRIAIKSSRPDGLAAALGMGIGATIFAVLAPLGLVAILLHVEWLYLALRVLGGLYLVYLGIRIWRGASEPIDVSGVAENRPSTAMQSLGLGLFTQLSNPKTAIVYTSIFATFLPENAPAWLLMVLPPLVFMLETTWYVIVAIAFSARRPRSFYLSMKIWIDRIAGAVMGALGARLVLEAFTPRS